MKYHPTIESLNVSKKAKAYFNKYHFYEFFSNDINVNPLTCATENLCSFSIDIHACNENDILTFYNAIITAKKQYLQNNNIHMDMIFYTWYCQMSGNFYFSIRHNDTSKSLEDQKQPFECTINHVKSLQNIILNFVNDQVKGIIPLDDLKNIDIEDVEDDDESTKYVLDVWSTVL